MRLPQLVTDESRFRQLEQQCRRGCGELARRENTRSTATVVGVLAVATFGLLLFLGRAPVRRVIEVVFGTFVLFGVSAIGAGIMRGLDGSANDPEAVASPAPPPPIEPIAQAQPAAVPPAALGERPSTAVGRGLSVVSRSN